MPLPIKKEDLDYITKKVYALYAKYGFEGISMDEVSRQTNISKATLYRYFTSKEEIVRGMSAFLIAHLDSVQFNGVEEISDVTAELREFYVKSILTAALSGSSFLTDLRRRFPDAYEACELSMSEMQSRFSGFYRLAVEKGFFRDLSVPLVSCQFSNMLPRVIDMDYLERNDLTLEGALEAYYRMFLCQILNDNFISVTERVETCDFIPELAAVLQNDFFIDSIRR